MNETKKPETRTVNEFEARTLIFEDTKRGAPPTDAPRRFQYLWGEGETSDVVGPGSLSNVNLDWGSGKYFLFYIEDSYFPPMYVVQHSTFEDAYDEFIDWQVEQLKIEGTDILDYVDWPDDIDEKDRTMDMLNSQVGQQLNVNCGFSSNGVAVDTEGVKGFEVRLVEARA